MSDDLYQQLKDQISNALKDLSTVDEIEQVLEELQTQLTASQTQLSLEQFRALWAISLIMAGYRAWQLGDNQKAFDIFQRGLACAEQHWSLPDITDNQLRTDLLNLYFNCGFTARQLGDNQKAFDIYQRGLACAEQHWSLPDITDNQLRTDLLKLYVNCGVTARQLGDNQKAFDIFQRGLACAEQHWLKNSKLTSEIYEQILFLLHNQMAAERSLLQRWIEVGYFSWRAPNKVRSPFPNDAQISLLSQHWGKLSHAESMHLTQQSLALWARVLKWHDPKRAHRHLPPMTTLTSTEQLLQLSQCLFLLERLEEQQGLSKAYKILKQLDITSDKLLNTKFYKTQFDTFTQPLESLNEKIQADWQVLFPKKSVEFSKISHNLEQLSRWKKVFYYRRVQTLEQNRDAYRALYSREQEEKTLCYKSHGWDSSLTNVNENLLDWLLIYLTPNLPVLSDFDRKLLATLMQHQKISMTESEPAILKDQEILSEFWQQQIFEPVLERHPNEKSEKLEKELSGILQNAWHTIGKQARYLAAWFAQLDDPNLNKPLNDEYKYKSSDYHQILETCLKQSPIDALKIKIRHWFGLLQGNPHSLPPKQAVAHFYALFERCLSIVPYQYRSNYSKDVHNWTKEALYETLQHDSSNLNKIFQYLEDARLALHSRHFNLNIGTWQTETNRALFKALEVIHHDLATDRNIDPENEPCPLLITWFEQIKSLLPNISIDTIQTKLRLNESIIQPFFDETSQPARLRLLCLDRKNGLHLVDLPEECALAEHWLQISEQWGKQLETLHQHQLTGQRGNYANLPDLIEILKSDSIQKFTQFLSELAFERLTVIFPAPLSQLPWEAVSSDLANCLVREISLQHWLDQQTAVSTAKNAYWLTADPSGKKGCMVKEIKWLERHLQQQAAIPCKQRYELLDQLQITRHIHLSTHGSFKNNDPFNSYLTLDDSEKKIIPLWLLTLLHTEVDVIILSSCESCLTGKETNELLTPVGLAPSLAAMGAKTVIGTLWACDGLAAWFFNYYFYQFAKKFPEESWHLILERSRQAIKSLTGKELSRIAKKENLYDQHDPCENSVLYYQTRDFPFEAPYYWAGFVMMGGTDRCQMMSESEFSE